MSLVSTPPKNADYEKAKARRQQVKIEVFEHYCHPGPTKCQLCPETRISTLTIDHIEGAGNQHRKSLNVDGGWRFYQWLQQQGYPPGYRVLCINCNHKQHQLRSAENRSQTKMSRRVRIFMDRIKQDFFSRLGTSCVLCDCADLDILTAHHQNGDGSAHRRRISRGKGGTWFYQAVLKSGDFTGLETRCFSCNVVDDWK